MIKAIIFDVDGVIFESADIKTLAFKRLFQEYSPDEVNKMLDYHLRNMGISRYVKFKYFFESILGKNLSKKEEEELGVRFSNIVVEEVLKAPFVSGTLDFLKNSYLDYSLFIASGTPQGELDYIVSERKLSDYFKKVYGSPQEKTSIINNILENNSLRKDEAVFIGDAESDLKAARGTGISFILRVSSGSCNLKNICKHKINDLMQLREKIREIEDGGLKKPEH